MSPPPSTKQTHTHTHTPISLHHQPHQFLFLFNHMIIISLILHFCFSSLNGSHYCSSSSSLSLPICKFLQLFFLSHFNYLYTKLYHITYLHNCVCFMTIPPNLYCQSLIQLRYYPYIHLKSFSHYFLLCEFNLHLIFNYLNGFFLVLMHIHNLINGKIK